VKNVGRDILVAFAVLLTLPLWLPALFSRWLRVGDDAFLTCSQIVGFFPGKLGIYLRRGFYWMTLEQFGRDCGIGCATWFSHPQDSNRPQRVHWGAVQHRHV
jgi:hypothetical protein